MTDPGGALPDLPRRPRRRPTQQRDPSALWNESRQNGRLEAALWLVSPFIATTAIYRLVEGTAYSRASILFVFIPAVLFVLTVTTTEAHTWIGRVWRFLVSGMFLLLVLVPEGFICVLFALPLIAVVSLILGAILEMAARAKHTREHTERNAILLLLLVLALSTEGVLPATTFGTTNTVAAERVLDLPVDEWERRLATAPEFDGGLPLIVSGFPGPVEAEGHGLDVGDRRIIRYDDGAHQRFLITDSHRAVDGAGRAVFTTVDDTTMAADWAILERSTVTWEPTVDGRTRVRWEIRFERRLHPTAYFTPLQRYAMERTAGYLIDTIADTEPAAAPEEFTDARS